MVWILLLNMGARKKTGRIGIWIAEDRRDAFNGGDEAVAQLAVTHGRNGIVVGTQTHHFGV